MKISYDNEPLDFEIGEVKNLSTRIADRLSEMIQNGQLRPCERLVQTVLAQCFGISRVTIRDALQLLKQKGLAISVKSRGIIVRPVTIKSIQDMCIIRRLVESYAVIEACSRITKENIEVLKGIIREQEELVQSMQLKKLLAKDWEFHKTIYNLCENELIRDVISLLWVRMQHARGLGLVDKKWGRAWGCNSINRHQLLLKALQKGDAEKAGKIFKETIDLSGEHLLQGLRETGWID